MGITQDSTFPSTVKPTSEVVTLWPITEGYGLQRNDFRHSHIHQGLGRSSSSVKTTQITDYILIFLGLNFNPSILPLLTVHVNS